ncbi:MAG TPA: TonB-dependent receptor plug domain-containing protein, partial [Gemmatimonadaceae bacterium]|nr:TonB-dependent receptor plug domain-containing protein [Gemmatimonadaceae bacterium]
MAGPGEIIISHRGEQAIPAARLVTTFVLLGWQAGAAVALAEPPTTADITQPPPSAAIPFPERQLPEVTVTANRREESNQRVPVAITALNADTTDKVGVTDAQSMAALVPGLLFNRQANASIPFLRGVGTPVGESGDEPSVALYIDGVYMPAGSASMANFTSIDHIEVEKGPQGTLFGRNAIAGTVNVVTRAPTDEFSGYLNAEIG